jgi:hypothetical protein
MPEHIEEKLRDWLSACPYAEYTDVNYVEEDSRVYIVNVSIALEKESEDA